MSEKLATLTQSIMLIFKCVILFRPEAYLELTGIQEVLLRGLLYKGNLGVRNQFQQLIYFLCQNVKPAKVELSKSPLGDFLLSMLDTKVLLVEVECEEYTELLNLLMDMYKIYDAQGDKIINVEQKLKDLLQCFSQHRSTETFKSAPDFTLLSLIKIIEKLLNIRDRLDLPTRIATISEVFSTCLFPIQESLDSTNVYAIKCKSNRTREAAFSLLTKVFSYKDEPALFLMKDCLLPLAGRVRVPQVWYYSPEGEERSSSGFVGIKNLGSICYASSMMQQFFMISPLRNALLSVSDLKLPVLNEAGIDDNLLHQIQNLLGYLVLSVRKDYNPGKFCHSFKEQDGRPLNTLIQHDAYEFLNIFLERLERILKDTPHNMLLQGIFGGRLCSQIKCESCGNISSVYEDYYTLSLEIKNQRSLHDALDKFVSWNIVSDYYCEECKKKMDVAKRTILSTLPNVLIVHLQRFTFNFDTFINEKVAVFLANKFRVDSQQTGVSQHTRHDPLYGGRDRSFVISEVCGQKGGRDQQIGRARRHKESSIGCRWRDGIPGKGAAKEAIRN